MLYIYSEKSSARLIYTLDWMLGEVLGVAYQVVQPGEGIEPGAVVMRYGTRDEGSVCIPDCGLLFEQGISRPAIATAHWQGIPVLFADSKGGYSMPFDIFSAVFYLLSRYEEYLPFAADKHNRFPVSESFLQQQGWLERPLVDEWIAAFSNLLEAKGVATRKQAFSFKATYDIDIAFSWRYKSIKRTVGTWAKNLFTRPAAGVQQLLVLSGLRPDPFDCFNWLEHLHREQSILPQYFVLVAGKTTRYDKNNLPGHPAMKRLIADLSRQGHVALHPSYYSHNETIFSAETKTLESITGQKNIRSRQHYLRWRLPESYRFLQQRGISEDWSMGFGAAAGFRAGTGRSFLWFDLEQETSTTLRIYPFCFMDSTAHFEMKLKPEEAFSKLDAMAGYLRATGSCLTTVFHNFSLGSDPQWNGWRDEYARFIGRITT